MKLFQLVTFPIPTLSLLLLLLVVLLSPVHAGAFSSISTRRNSLPIKVDVSTHMFNNYQSSYDTDNKTRQKIETDVELVILNEKETETFKLMST